MWLAIEKVHNLFHKILIFVVVLGTQLLSVISIFKIVRFQKYPQTKKLVVSRMYVTGHLHVYDSLNPSSFIYLWTFVLIVATLWLHKRTEGGSILKQHFFFPGLTI